MPVPPYVPESSWSWPEAVVAKDRQDQAPAPEPYDIGDVPFVPRKPEPEPAAQSHEDEASSDTPPKPAKHYSSRTCRICLEVVQPSFETGPGGLAGMVAPTPKVQYVSEDPASGRLIRPCKCKGTQSYVHEGCLQDWRYADASFGRRNFFECPTCKYTYRLERMRWSKWIGSALAQVALTVLIFVVTVFLLGFAAEPIVKLYLDPWESVTNPIATLREPLIEFDEGDGWTWSEHILKGVASLGIIGFAKTLLMSPWNWFQMRRVTGGGGGNRRGGTGRERIENISGTVIMIGIATAVYAIWKGVHAWSRRTLEKAEERVVDVHGDVDDDDDPDAGSNHDPEPTDEADWVSDDEPSEPELPDEPDLDTQECS